MTRTLEQTERLGRLRVRGSKLTSDVEEAVTSARLELGTDLVTELALTLADPGLNLLRSGLFREGAFVDYGDLRLLIDALEVGPGSAGTGGLTVDCRPVVVDKLKRRRGPLILRGVSPSTFVLAELKAVGARGVVQPSATRKQVARDVPSKTDAGAQDEPPSSWTTLKRLAKELGYLVYEVAGVVYFGRPSWLLKTLPTVRVTHGSRDESKAPVTVPTARRVREGGRVRATLSLELDATWSDVVRPGKALILAGVPTFDGRYLIDKVGFDLAGTGLVAVECSTPEDPKPEPAEDTDKDGIADGDDYDVKDAPSSATSASGVAGDVKPTKAVNDFVNQALRQAGDEYRLGAEARPGDADPDAFDCSELVEWALARVGVKFVDGSSNQRARCKAIPVEQAKRTRGALLFHPGHVAISLGDGRTIEAMGRKYGVRTAAAGSRFTSGGLIPGLDYGKTR